MTSPVSNPSTTPTTNPKDVRRALLVSSLSHCKSADPDFAPCYPSHGCSCGCFGCTAAKNGGAR
jgi:hypothetical protein